MCVKVFAIFFSLLLLISVFPMLFALPNDYKVATDRAVNYLVLNYNETVGLISETVNGSTFWLYSDNFLASLVLLYYDDGNLTCTRIGSMVSQKLEYYLGKYNVKAYSKYNVLCKEDLVAFNSGLNFTLEDGVKVDLNNGTSPLNPSEYGDVAFLMALYYYRRGDLKKATDYFNIGAGMYDGIGINDIAFKKGESKGIYQTYKLALFYLAGYVLGYSVPDNVINRILSLQASNGGFYTGYYPNGTIPEAVVTNTETTALAVYALSPQIARKLFSSHINLEPFLSLACTIVFVLFIATVLVIFIKRIKF